MLGVLFVMGLSFQVRAGFHEVTVSQEVDQNGSMMTMVRMAKEAAFVRAAHREALTILPSSLEKARSRVLLEILKPRAEEYVFSYSELKRRLDSQALELRMSVGVNGQALKAFLKSWGIYYTSRQFMSCSVSVQGGAEGLRQRVDRLMLITGVKSSFFSVERSLKVVQTSTEPESWELRLTGPETTLTKRGQKLESVWHDLWSEYFSRPDVQGRFGQTFLISISGWTTSTELESFQTRLANWSRELDTAELQRVDIKPEGLDGTWLVRTMDRKALESRLQQETGHYGLEVRMVPAEEGVGASE